MIDESVSADRIRLWIDRLAEGDDQACTDLINHTASAWRPSPGDMFKDFGRLGRWEQTEDICQNASMRLWNALKSTRPRTPAEFHRLAALQIRRELIDQVRRHFGPEGIGANHASNFPVDPRAATPPEPYDAPQSTYDPVKLSCWAEFHKRGGPPSRRRAICIRPDLVPGVGPSRCGRDPGHFRTHAQAQLARGETLAGTRP